MGFIFSRFKKKTPVEQLENVDEEIKELQACNADTQMRHRQITKQLLVYSSGLSTFSAVVLYFYFPPTVESKILLGAVVLICPFLYYVLSKIISWYYTKKIKTSHSRLKDLRKEKERLINEIMDKETYKVAKDILEKFAPETLPSKFPATTGSSIALHRGEPQSRSPPPMARPRPILPRTPAANEQMLRTLNQVVMNNAGLNRPPAIQPAPIFPRDKSYVERMFEYLIGEGPNSKYALICSNCSTHNGMALEEEFEYTAFRCYSCRFLNPARKQRPLAPKLESAKSEFHDQRSEPESSSSSISDDQDRIKIEEVNDTEEEEVANVVAEVSETNEEASGDYLSLQKEEGTIVRGDDSEGNGFLHVSDSSAGMSVENLSGKASEGILDDASGNREKSTTSTEESFTDAPPSDGDNVSKSSGNEYFHPLPSDSRTVVNGSSPF